MPSMPDTTRITLIRLQEKQAFEPVNHLIEIGNTGAALEMLKRIKSLHVSKMVPLAKIVLTATDTRHKEIAYNMIRDTIEYIELIGQLMNFYLYVEAHATGPLRVQLIKLAEDRMSQIAPDSYKEEIAELRSRSMAPETYPNPKDINDPDRCLAYAGSSPKHKTWGYLQRYRELTGNTPPSEKYAKIIINKIQGTHGVGDFVNKIKHEVEEALKILGHQKAYKLLRKPVDIDMQTLLLDRPAQGRPSGFRMLVDAYIRIFEKEFNEHDWEMLAKYALYLTNKSLAEYAYANLPNKYRELKLILSKEFDIKDAELGTKDEVRIRSNPVWSGRYCQPVNKAAASIAIPQKSRD